MPTYKRIYQLPSKVPSLTDKVVLDASGLPEAASASLNDVFNLFKANIPTFNTGGGLTYVNLDAQSTDYDLGVNEVGVRTFSAQQTVPLMVATGSGRIYRFVLATSSPSLGTSGGSSAPILLQPNNTTYANQFLYREVYRNNSGLSSSATTYSAFRIGWSVVFTEGMIQNFTTAKVISGKAVVWGGSSDSSTITDYASAWNDTTTNWTSLGTVVFPVFTSGTILVWRIY